MHRNNHSVVKMAELFDINRSSYYAWIDRPESNRNIRHKDLTEKVLDIYTKSGKRYGSPRIHEALREDDIICSPKTVVKIMRENGIRAKGAKKYKATTNSKHDNPVAENLLARNFTVNCPNRVWVSDITYIYTEEGWLYLCVIIDLYSRKVVGWSMSNRCNTAFVLLALSMAITNRKPDKKLIFHSDRGVQYTSKDFQKELKKHGFVCSMSRKGDCWDNACAESFFHSLKVEEVHHHQFKTREEARSCIFEYLEVFYNRVRMHSTLGYKSPVNFEKIRA